MEEGAETNPKNTTRNNQTHIGVFFTIQRRHVLVHRLRWAAAKSTSRQKSISRRARAGVSSEDDERQARWHGREAACLRPPQQFFDGTYFCTCNSRTFEANTCAINTQQSIILQCFGLGFFSVRPGFLFFRFSLVVSFVLLYVLAFSASSALRVHTYVPARKRSPSRWGRLDVCVMEKRGVTI